MTENTIKVRTIKAQDGAIWAVPVDVIARNRAEQYASEFGGDVKRSLAEDTLPLFEADEYEIHDWAANNMNWSDVQASAWKLRDPPETHTDMQEAWVNGGHGFETVISAPGKQTTGAP